MCKMVNKLVNLKKGGIEGMKQDAFLQQGEA